MNERLRTFVDALFENAPTTPRVYDLKEELLANLEEKYSDLLAAGASEADAYTHVVAGIGDAEALIASLTNEQEESSASPEEARARTAQVVATSAFLYCLAIAARLLVRMVLGQTLGWVAFWVVAGFATAQTVYHFMTHPGGYAAAMRLPTSRKRRRQLFGTFSSILWLSTTIIYFVYSFTFGGWRLSWLVFLVATILQQVLRLIMRLEDE